jgi:acetyl coenzyme A synthetase (ADP forming)-like protein
MNGSLTAFFKPSGVAVIGASTKPNKLSYGIVKNLSRYHYRGAIYPINPNAQEILGLRCYADVRAVPDPVELAVIVLPAGMTLEALKSCVERGIKAVIIISGGFREIGETGKALEEACLRIAKRNGMRIIGPNCVGTMDMYSGCNTTFIEGMPEAGPIGFVSQSGAVCGGVVDLVVDKHVGFSHFASLGNEMDVSESDMIEYLGEDDNVKVIAVYVEGIQDGKRFMDVARKVSAIKPIVMLKAGRSEAGARAVSSHTGSLAGSHAAYKAAFEQSGVIEVNDIQTLFNVAWGLGCQPLPRGRRAAITTNAGGPAALASDSLAANKFTLAEVSRETQSNLREKLNPSAQVSNPVDMLGGAEPNEYDWSLQTLIKDDGVDVLLPILVPQALVDQVGVAQAFVDNAKRTNKTLLSCMMGDASVKEARALLHQNRVPMYQYPEEAGRVLGAMDAYSNYLHRKTPSMAVLPDIRKEEGEELIKKYIARDALGEVETRPLLQAYGIPVVPGDLARDAQEAVRIADEIGFPVVMKIVSKDILHKSDAGGIKLNLNGAIELKIAYDEMFQSIAAKLPEASLEGVLIEKMVPKGQEVIVGMRRDATFGPLMMFGMGGVFVELIKDVAFKVAPLSSDDISDMISSTYAGKLLKGFRGSAPADVIALSNVIARLGQLAVDFPELDEIEINPLLVFNQGEGVLSLDSRAILKRSG